MTTIKYTLRNAHKGIKMGTYSDDSDGGVNNETGLTQIYFHWDHNNEKLDTIAWKEFRLSLGDGKKNMLWIEDLKTFANWKKGEYIYAFTKNNSDGTFYVNWTKSKTLKCGSKFNWYNLIVEPNGYVSMECFNYYTNTEDDDIKYNFWVRVESIYNDKMCNLINK